MTAPGPRKPHLHGAQNALGEFLRARRRLVTPEEAGIPVTGRRRAPGLRREELAMLAGVSSPYYIRLEQGHDRHPSAQVVDALGHALRLDDETFAYLKRLAGQVAIETRAPGDESVRSTVAQLVHGLQDVAALVIGRYRDVLVANRLAPMLHVAYTPGENLLRFLFLDPRARERVIDWEQVARQAVSTLRVDSSANIDDTHLGQLIDELSRQSPQFRDLWTPPRGHHVHHRSAALQQPCRRDHHRELRVLPGRWGSWAIAGDRLPHRGWGGRTETEAAQAARRQTTSYIALIQTQLIGDQLRGRPRDVLAHGCRSQADPRADTPTAVWLDHRKMPNLGSIPIAPSSGRKCHARQAI